MTHIKRGEIYYANISPGIGCEQAGNRPVLILQNDIGNKYSTTTIIAPITGRKTTRCLPTHVRIGAAGLARSSIVLLEQIRVIDKRRLGRYVGKLSRRTMWKIDRAITVSLGLSVPEVLPQ